MKPENEFAGLTPDELIDKMRCPECHQKLEKTGGCLFCFGCGWSACG